MKITIFVALLGVLVSGVSSETPEEVLDQQVANHYTDEIVGKTTKSLIDVLELPDNNLTVTYKLLVADFDAVCRLKDGKATGMRSLQRHRDAEIEYTKRHMLVKLPSEFQNMTVTYRVIMNIWKSVFDINLKADIRSSEVLTTVKVPRNSDVVTLEEVSVRYLSGVKIDMRGLGQVSWPVRPLSAKIVQFLNDGVAVAIEKHLTNIMEPIVTRTLYPSVWTY